MTTYINKLKQTARKGSILVMVLVSMVILSAVILFSLNSAADDTQASYRALFMLQARYMSEGATERAKGDLLCQIAATNFLGGNFNTVGTLYANINQRFNVADKRIPGTTASEDIDWRSAATINRARWDFASDSTLSIAGVNDWGIGPAGANPPLGIVRTYITRSIIDEQGDVNNNTVGSYETTLTSWAEIGGGPMRVAAITSKSFSHGLVFPRLFDFLYLGNALSDCSMCHLKIMGDIGQVNAADPFEMHISYNSSRFNRLTLYGSIYTNGNFVRAAQGEAQGPNRQERMMYAPGEDNNYSKPELGVKPKMLIFARNGGQLSTQFNAESNNPYPNPFRTIETLATPLPSTWPSVKNNLLEWFEPRAITSAASNSARLEMEAWDNNIGYVAPAGITNPGALPWLRPVRPVRPVTNDNFATTPQTVFQPYNLRSGTALWRFDGTLVSEVSPNDPFNVGMNPFRYTPFIAPTLFSTATNTRVLYGVQDVFVETVNAAFTAVSARVSGGDGIPDLDMNEDGVVDAVDDAMRIYPYALDRAINRWQLGTNNRQNVNSNRTLIINRGLHPIDDFDYDTIPNGFDPDMDGDGIPESPRASNDPTSLGYHVTSMDAVDNGWVVWVDGSGREASDPGFSGNFRPQWKLGMQKIRFASWTAPYNPLPTVYWVRHGALLFTRMSDNNLPSRPGSNPTQSQYDSARNQSNLHAVNAQVVDVVQAAPPAGQFFRNVDVTVWLPTTTSQTNPSPVDVWVGAGASKCYPVILNSRTNWSNTADNHAAAYLRANRDVMEQGRISRLYNVVDTSPLNLVNRNFSWEAEISGIASAGGGRTAMENLILNQVRTEVTGVFPNATRETSGNPVLATNPGERSLLVKGSKLNPIRLAGQIVIRGDLVITGPFTGTGTIVTHRNVYIPNDLRYVNPPDYFDFDNLAGDQLGLISAANIMVGNLIHNTTGRNDLMEFVWGNMVDINSADISGATSWNYGRDGTAKPAFNHMINPVYLFDGANAGVWENGQWMIENEGNCVDERFNAQGMRLGGGLVANSSNPRFNDARRHVNFDGNSNPTSADARTSRFRNYWISTPGLLPEGASRINAMPTTFFGQYSGAWFSPEDFKVLTQLSRVGSGDWTNTMANTRTEAQNSWIKVVEGVLYADYGVIGGNLANSVGPNFLEFRGAVIGRDIQILSARSNNSSDDGSLKPPQHFFGTNLVGGLYYDHRLRGSINPLGFPFEEKFLGGEMASNYLPPVVNGNRDNWRPFRLREEYKFLVQE